MKLSFLFMLGFALSMSWGFGQSVPEPEKDEQKFESLYCEKSTAIEFANYFPETGRLDMAFKSRPEKVYTYQYFPRDIWLMWTAAESKGQFHLRNIKGQRFRRPQKESGNSE